MAGAPGFPEGLEEDGHDGEGDPAGCGNALKGGFGIVR